jgi:carbon storage regulator CsrA
MTMLVLSRKLGEQVRIGSDITLVVLEVKGGRVRIGIEAPARVRILRKELHAPPAGPGVANERWPEPVPHAV